MSAVLVLMVISFVPSLSDSSDAATGSIGTDVTYLNPTDTVSIPAGEQKSVVFYINYAGTDTRYISVSASSSSSDITVSDIDIKEGSTSYGSSHVLISSSILTVSMMITVDSYAHQSHDYSTTVTIESLPWGSGATSTSGEFDISLDVTSNLSSDKYNKFFGVFANDFDGVLGDVWFTAVVSFFGLLIFGYVVMFIAVPVCTRIVMKKDDPGRATLKKLLYQLCQVIIWLWVIGQIFRICGASEEVIDMINKLFYLAYVVVGVIVGWQLYKLIIDLIISKAVSKAADYEMEEKRLDFESFRPLFMYIGEIVLSIVAVMLIMNLLGFDLAAIITSAGLVSLGISMGAQDVLKQFFSGLEILATRPFKTGDIITIGTDSTIFVVRKVNVMNTFLANWDNTDINIMPNSTITTSKIRNMTRDTLLWKVYLSVEVAYGTDVALARTLVQEAASQNPHVVTDGSVGRPYTRLDAFGDDNLVIKMGFYVDNFNNQYSVSGQIRQDIIQKFNEHGINIDYAQVVIHQAEPEIRGNTTARPRSPSSPQ